SLQVPQRRLLDTQLIDLVLGEVSDSQALRAVELAAEQRKIPDDRLEERGLAGAVRAEQSDRVARQDAPLDLREHRVARIADPGLLEREELARLLGGRPELELEGRVDVGGGDALELLQRVDAALRLARLRRFRSKAV